MKSKIGLFFAAIVFASFSMVMAETYIPAFPAMEDLSEEAMKTLPEPLKTFAKGKEWEGTWESTGAWQKSLTSNKVATKIKIAYANGKIRCFHAWGAGWKMGTGVKEYTVENEGDAVILRNEEMRAVIRLVRNTKDKNKFEGRYECFGLSPYNATFTPVAS
jgi:hypothetical protein